MTDNTKKEKTKKRKKSLNRKTMAKFKDKIKDLSSRTPLINTSITIKTSDLDKSLQNQLFRNRLIDFVTGFSAFCTGILGMGNCFKVVNLQTFNILSVLALIANVSFWSNMFLIILGILVCSYAYKRPSTKLFINNIISSLYDSEEYTAIILMKAQVNGTPKILVQRQESWQSYFLPYCHYNPEASAEDMKKRIQSELSHTMELPEHMFVIETPYLNNEFHRIKKNPSHGTVSLIHFRFYAVRLQSDISHDRFTKTHSQHHMLSVIT